MNRTNWIKHHGHQYKKDTGVIVDVQHDLPIVGQIQEIYLVDGYSIAFHLKVYSTTYEPHYRAYLLKKDYTEKILQLSSLFVETPVHIRRAQSVGTHAFIILPFALCTL